MNEKGDQAHGFCATGLNSLSVYPGLAHRKVHPGPKKLLPTIRSVFLPTRAMSHSYGSWFVRVAQWE